MRHPLVIARTPLPDLPEVTLYRDTWLEHIVARHPVMEHRSQEVVETLAFPDIVWASPVDPTRLVFTQSRTITNRGSRLMVVVDRREALVCTAFYNRAMRVGTVIWVP